MKRLLRILSAVMIIAILACVCVACGKNTPTDKTNPNDGATDEETTIESVIGKLYTFDRITCEYTEEGWKKVYERGDDEITAGYFSEDDVYNDDFKKLYNDCYTYFYKRYSTYEGGCPFEIKFKTDGKVESVGNLFFYSEGENITWVKTDDEIKIIGASEKWQVKAVGKNEITMYVKSEQEEDDDSSEKMYLRFIETKVAGTVSGKTYRYEKSVIKVSDNMWNKIYQNRMEINKKLEEPIFTENDVLNDDFKEKCNKAFAEPKGAAYKACTFKFNENGECISKNNGQESLMQWEQIGNAIKFNSESEYNSFGVINENILRLKKEAKGLYVYGEWMYIYIETYLIVAE